LRDGELAFDLPSAEVSRDRLTRLYAQAEHELSDTAPAPDYGGESHAPAAVSMAR
jgi:phosphonate transport system ATP-binding protein